MFINFIQKRIEIGNKDAEKEVKFCTVELRLLNLRVMLVLGYA